MRRVRRSWTDERLDDFKDRSELRFDEPGGPNHSGRRASSGIRLAAVEKAPRNDPYLLSGQAVKLTAARQLDGVVGQ
jgi:hypothetical protein